MAENMKKDEAKENETQAVEDQELLQKLESWFEADESFDRTWKAEAKEWYSYYHGDQWTGEEASALYERGQAVVTYNHIKPSIDAVIGGERSNRPQITMAPRTLDDASAADTKSELYRFIEYNSNSDDELDRALLDVFVTGRGWIKIEPTDSGADIDLRHRFVDYRDMFIDGFSKRDDLSDCRRIHEAVFTDEDEVASAFDNFKEGDGQSEGFMFDSSSDDGIWFMNEGDRRRLRLIETWYRDDSGKINTVIWVKGKILYKKDMPYDMNRYPFAMMTDNRTLDNLPYGKVKAMISAQDEVNKRHSKAMHYLNAKQVWAEESAFKDLEDAKKTLAKPDGVTVFNDDALKDQRVLAVDNIPLAQAHIQMMQIAKENIMTLIGLNAGYMGQASSSDSGAKVGLNIQQAQNVLIPTFNKIRRFRHDIAKITMDLVREFYTTERIVRITKENGEYAFMPINGMQMDEFGVVNMMNDVTIDDIDIIVADAPTSLNEQQEQFNALLMLQGQTSQPIPPNILLRYSNIKDKNKLAAEIEATNNLQAVIQQQQQVMAQMEEQIKMLGGTIKQYENQLITVKTSAAVEKEVSKTKEKLASAGLK